MADASAASGDARTPFDRLEDMSLNVPTAVGLALGLAVLVLTHFLVTLGTTNEIDRDGFFKTIAWFGWIGTTLVSLSLVAGALTPGRARAGVRVAMAAIGLYLFFTHGPAVGAPSFPVNVFF